METKRAINTLLRTDLWACGPAPITRALEGSPLLRRVTEQVEEDARAFAGKDPACQLPDMQIDLGRYQPQP